MHSSCLFFMLHSKLPKQAVGIFTEPLVPVGPALHTSTRSSCSPNLTPEIAEPVGIWIWGPLCVQPGSHLLSSFSGLSLVTMIQLISALHQCPGSFPAIGQLVPHGSLISLTCSINPHCEMALSFDLSELSKTFANKQAKHCSSGKHTDGTFWARSNETLTSKREWNSRF